MFERWRRLRSSMALTAAAAVALLGLFGLLAPDAAEAACGGDQVTAVYYNWDAEGGAWKQVGEPGCLAGPSGGSFAQDFSAGLPEGVSPEQFRVVMSGSLAGAAGAWYQFSSSGGVSYSVDGLSPGPYLQLNGSNALSAVFEQSGGGGSAFTISWSEVSTACAAGQMSAVYGLVNDPARVARVIRCEDGPSGMTFERKPADLPSLSGDYRASYTGQLPLSQSGWYQFQSSLKSGDSLSASVGGVEVVGSVGAGGYLELDGSGALAVSYTKTGGGQGGFTLSWSLFQCDAGLFLAAYYDGPQAKNRAGTLRCEPMPSGASLADGAKSAKWSGKVYFEGGSYSFTGSGDLKYALDGGTESAVGGSAVTVSEGLHTLTLFYRKETGTVTAGATNQATGVSLPRCPEGRFARTGTGLAPTCVAAPEAGDGASYVGRLWFQGASYAVTSSGLTGLTVGGAAVGETETLTVAAGAHDVAFTASGGSVPGVSFRVTGGCPEGAFLGQYSVAGSVVFGACEPAPGYNWGTAARPPGVSGGGAFAATWSGLIPLERAGLYQFSVTGDTTPSFNLGSYADLSPGLYAMDLAYTSGASPSVGLSWDGAYGCPDGLYKAEYFAGADGLSGSPYLVTCEAEPYLTYQRSWMGDGPYAVRWTGRMALAPGQHDLVLTASGSASLYVDGSLAASAAPGETLTVSSPAWDMARGYHELKLEYTGGGEWDFVRLQRKFQTPASDPSTGCPSGWFKVEWWNSTTPGGTAASTTCESGPPGYRWSFNPPAAITGSDWSARWTGTVSFPAGRYRFHIQARNAVRVLVGGQPVIEEFTFGESYPNRPLWSNGMHVTDAEVNLAGGATQIVIEYATSAAQVPGVDPAPVSGSGLKVWWEAAGAPALIGAGFTSPSTLQLRYDSVLDSSAAPGAASFLLSAMDGTTVGVSSVAISGNTATLSLGDGKSMTDGEQLIVRYDPNLAGALRGEAAPMLPLNDLAAGREFPAGSSRVIDLGDVYSLSELKLFGGEGCCSALTVSLSLDGASWSTVRTYSGSGSFHSSGRPYLRLLPVAVKAARYIRVAGDGADQIASVQAWGGSAGNPAAAPSPLTGTGPVNVALGKATAATGTVSAGHGTELGVNGYTTRRMAGLLDVADYFAVTGDNPAWQVDLGGLYLVSSIRLYNRSDCCYTEADGFSLETSADGATWAAVSTSGETFGGPNAPYIRADLPERAARYVRVRLDGAARTLHLAEVQVYGTPAVASLIVPYHGSGPTLSRGIDVIDDVVMLRYDKVMDSASLPPVGAFAVRVDGATYQPVAVQLYGQDVVLYLPVRTDPTMHVAVRYQPVSGSPSLQDLTGKAAAAIDLQDARYLAVVPENVALGKPVTYSGTASGASNGVNGVRYFTGDTGSPVYDYFSITDGSAAPYWQVDLRDAYAIAKIRLFNRYDSDWAAADSLKLQLSVDGTTWRTVYRNSQQRSPATFGNPPGEPLVVDLTYENARYLRVTLDGPGTLSLAEVQVYGLPALQAWNVAQFKPATVGEYTQWVQIHLGEQPPAGTGESELYNPARAVDGDVTTAVQPTGAWEVNLNRGYVLSRINILTDGVDGLGSYSLQYRAPGDTDWKTLDLAGRVLTEGNLLSIRVPAVEAQYLRLNATGSGYRLYEVEALGFPAVDLDGQRPLQNLAKQKPVSLLAAAGAFSQWEIPWGTTAPAPAQSPALAVDGDLATLAELAPMAASDPGCDCRQAFTADLQDGYRLTRAVIRFGTAAQASAFLAEGRVLLSADGVTWTSLALSGLATVEDAVLVLPLPGTPAQFVRLAADTIDPLQLAEVEVYGFDRELDR